MPNVDPEKWRKDKCGAWIYRSSYGKNNDYSWRIDHIKPKPQGGGDDLSNLQPLHWENYILKTVENMNCVVTSDGNKNMRKLIDRLDQVV